MGQITSICIKCIFMFKICIKYIFTSNNTTQSPVWPDLVECVLRLLLHNNYKGWVQTADFVECELY